MTLILIMKIKLLFYKEQWKSSSDELLHNKKLREETISLKVVNRNLADILGSMNLDAISQMR
jgi:hypothetical protein